MSLLLLLFLIEAESSSGYVGLKGQNFHSYASVTSTCVDRRESILKINMLAPPSGYQFSETVVPKELELPKGSHVGKEKKW